MKTMKHISIISTFFLTFLFLNACTENESAEVPFLNNKKLEEILRELPEFNAFLEHRIQTWQDITTHISVLSRDDQNWLFQAHSTFPHLKDFLSQKRQQDIEHYQFLSQQFFNKVNEESSIRMLAVLDKLNLLGNFEIRDLSPLLFDFPEFNSIAHIDRVCNQHCFLQASQKQNTNFLSCMDDKVYCFEQTEIQYRYYLTGYLAIC